MDTKLKSYFLYSIADALGVTVEYDEKTQKLHGETNRDVMFGDLPVTFDIKIVSSMMLSDQYMVICKVMGNLGMFVVAYRQDKKELVDLHFLNAARLDSFTNWLEKKQPKDAKAAVQMLGPAVVKSYTKTTRNKWSVAA